MDKSADVFGELALSRFQSKVQATSRGLLTYTPTHPFQRISYLKRPLVACWDLLEEDCYCFEIWHMNHHAHWLDCSVSLTSNKLAFHSLWGSNPVARSKLPAPRCNLRRVAASLESGSEELYNSLYNCTTVLYCIPTALPCDGPLYLKWSHKFLLTEWVTRDELQDLLELLFATKISRSYFQYQ